MKFESCFKPILSHLLFYLSRNVCHCLLKFVSRRLPNESLKWNSSLLDIAVYSCTNFTKSHLNYVSVDKWVQKRWVTVEIVPRAVEATRVLS